jgi:glycosyltransferase involved in cell wall biosynthesis
MKVLHLSTSDIDGGAARAAYRLHQGLLQLDIDSKMLVRAKFSTDSSVIGYKPLVAKLGSKLDSYPLRKYPKRKKLMFSSQWFPDTVVPKVRSVNPDIVHLHWTCNGYLRIESLTKLKKPLVWTLHDMWAFTGGCHYTQGCDHYTKGCGSCPQLGSSDPYDLSWRNWQRKAKILRNLNLTIVSPSQWLANCAKASPLFENCRIEVIPNGIDVEVYKPINQSAARAALNLPQDKHLVLFGAGSTSGDPRKGFHLLLSALQKLDANLWGDRLELVIFGESKPQNALPLQFQARYLGRLSDDVSLALAYVSADLFIAPSQEDNLPNTVMEALSCGTPCLAFDIGGMPDMIEHQKTGYLVQPFEIDDLVKGVEWILDNPARLKTLSVQARNHAIEKFPFRSCSEQILNIYKKY